MVLERGQGRSGVSEDGGKPRKSDVCRPAQPAYQICAVNTQRNIKHLNFLERSIKYNDKDLQSVFH